MFRSIFRDLAADAKENMTATVIAAIAALIPLVVYLRIVPLSAETAKLWPTDTNYDFFSFYKMIWFLFFTLIATVVFFMGVKNKKITFTRTWIYVPVGLYTLTTVLSSVFAKHIDVALYGFPDRYEGLFVVLGYILVFLITMNIAQNKGALKLILAGLLFSAFVASLIGLFQFIGRIELFGKSSGPMDFFKTSLGQMLITPSEYRGMLDLNFQFVEHEIYTTLYNTNFVGSFMGMMLMFFMVLFIYDSNKTRKVIFCILSMLIFSNWIGCLSRAGYLGVISATLLLFVIAVLRFKLSNKGVNSDFIKSSSKNLTIIISFLVVLFLVLDLSSKNIIGIQFSKLYMIMAGSGSVVLPGKTKSTKTFTSHYEIKDVKITPDTICFSTINTELRIKLVGNDLRFYTKEGIRINPTFANSDHEKFYWFNYLKYELYWFRLGKNNILYLAYRNAWIQVAITNEGFKFFDEKYGFTEINKAPSCALEGMERIPDKRLYLWSRTIPLLKDVIFLGNGSDTYAFYFPQQDYMGKLKYCDNPYLIIDKPHNMYLQIAMNTGILSLICVLIIFISYIATSIKIYISNNVRSVYSTVSLGVFLGTTAYMVTAVFNDSVISVAPVFWIMLGIGYAVNFVIIRENKIQRRDDCASISI